MRGIQKVEGRRANQFEEKKQGRKRLAKQTNWRKQSWKKSWEKNEEERRSRKKTELLVRREVQNDQWRRGTRTSLKNVFEESKQSERIAMRFTSVFFFLFFLWVLSSSSCQEIKRKCWFGSLSLLRKQQHQKDLSRFATKVFITRKLFGSFGDVWNFGCSAFNSGPQCY